MATIAEQLSSLPALPGVYLFKDEKGNVLYVGKAKVLRNRVRSYFRPLAALEPAKQQMVPLITTIDTITVHTEHEALILEANLIRQHQPPYNVVLTDDKYYLFIKITKDALPRVIPVRRLKRDGARYFGPYSSAGAVRHTLKLLRRLFPHLGDTSDDKTWLFPHPLFAAAKSEALHNEALYHDNIRNVIRFLEGKREQIMATLREGMQRAAKEKAYERAALFRDQLHAIEKLEGSQKVYLPRKESFDVVSIASAGNQSAANIFAIRDGKLLQKNTFLLRHRHAALAADILRQFVLQYYSVAQDIPKTILVPLPLPDQAALGTWLSATAPPLFVVPERGKKKDLLRMGELNAAQFLHTETQQFMTATRFTEALAQLAKALNITAPLKRIETYDISNIQGTLATGSMVVFTDGAPDKQQYKRFKIRTQDTPNDFAMLQEVLRRRFRPREVAWPTPDLLIIDGGKGQLSAVQAVLQELSLAIPIISLAKREEEVFVPGQREAVRLPFDSDALYLLQRMRDEAHRFTLQYHRLLRSKHASRSLLDEVPGVGPKLKKKLLSHFGSLKAIRAATDEELSALIGGAKTKILRDYL